MLKIRTNILISTILIFLWSPFVEAETTLKATMNRFPDPVIVRAEKIVAISGGNLENYRVYAKRNEILVPIRFQIDEINKKGDFVFHHGKRNNSGDSNGKLDSSDLLMFMAHDSGDRVTSDEFPKDVTRHMELTLKDPVDHSQSWVYVFFFENNPPPLCPLPDYFTYDYTTELLKGEYWSAKCLITEDGKHTLFYDSQSALKKAGGNGKSYVDRLKIRTNVSFFFGRLKLRLTEESLKSEVLAWNQGPIRVVKRGEQYVKAPLGMKALRAVVDVCYYETMVTVPVHFIIPFKMDNIVTEAMLSYGTDYSPVVKGSIYYSSTNPQGILIDGKMTESDQNFQKEREEWNVISGDWGSFMTRIVIPDYFKQYITATQTIIDDENIMLPPEGIPGSIGFVTQDINVGKLPKGKYTAYMEFYTIPYYKPGAEVPYLNYLDQPIVVKAGNEEFSSQVKLCAKVSKDF